MTVTAHDIIAWTRWAAEAKGAEQVVRRDRLQRYLFPDGLEVGEKRRREALVEYVKKMGEPPNWDGWPAAAAVPDGAVAPPVVPEMPALEWPGLVSSESRAYRRGSLHDGTAEEMDRMREQARGSPFFDAPASSGRPGRDGRGNGRK